MFPIFVLFMFLWVLKFSPDPDVQKKSRAGCLASNPRPAPDAQWEAHNLGTGDRSILNMNIFIYHAKIGGIAQF